MITHRNLLAMRLCYFADVDAIGAGRLHRPRGADVARLRALRAAARRCAAAKQVVPASGGFDAGRDLRARAAPTPASRCSPRRRWSSASSITRAAARPAASTGFKTIVYGGGPMYVADIQRRAARDGPALRADLRPGRDADDDHRARRARHFADSRAPAVPRALASVGVAQTRVEVRIADDDGPTAAGRDDRARCWCAATR